MNHQKLNKIDTISDAHKFLGLPKPENPLISVVNYADFKLPGTISEVKVAFNFYSISIKRNVNNKLFYGQQKCDFDEGILFYVANADFAG